jgi:hypothetical protein
MPAAMYDEFPEIMAITRIYDREQTVRIDDKFYNEAKAAAVDSGFTDIFTLNLIEGSPVGTLNEPGQVLLDQSTAQKYFGNGSALGKVIQIKDTVTLTVMGVFEDLPSQSHFHFNILYSLLSLDGLHNNPQWFANDFKTYFRLENGFLKERLEDKFPAFVNKYMYEGRYEESANDENYWKLYLQKLREIHLGSDNRFSLNANLTDEGYVETMGIKMRDGRFFSSDFSTDRDKIILNETAVELLELENPVGTIIYLWGNRDLPYEVIGVVKDYHWESKQMKVRPHAIMTLGERFRSPQYLSVKLRGGSIGNMIQSLKKDWERNVASIPFEYELLDTHYEGIYDNEKQTRSLLAIFTAITIIISCLGLFGLASFMSERRTKEIGIRKTFGASNTHIVNILSVDFIKWVLFANILAWPFAWYAMRKWLESFEYRVEITVWIFGLAGVSAILIAMATVSFHAIKACLMNPSIALKYE